MKVEVVPFLIKVSVLVLIWLLTYPTYSYKVSLFLSILVTTTYQYFIALFFPGVHVMPSMDNACFLGDDKSALVNFMSVTTLEHLSLDRAKEKARHYLMEKAKLRYHVVRIFGDLYWKEMADVD